MQPIYDIKAHPIRDGLIFSGSADKSIRLWNVWTGTVAAIFGGEGGHIDAVLSMDVNMAGTLMVSTGFDTYVKVRLCFDLSHVIIHQSFPFYSYFINFPSIFRYGI